MTERVPVIEAAEPELKQGRERRCGRCGAAQSGAPVCPACGALQPLGSGADLFALLGLPRKLRLDPGELERAFHALSRQLHPDMHRGAAGRERLLALENSSLLNQAYRTLRDPVERAAYLLRLESGDASERKDGPPAELFEEILEIQELIGDYRLADPEERRALRPQLEARREQLRAIQAQRAEELTGGLAERWDALLDREPPGETEEKAALLERMRRILGERAYLKRVLDGIESALGA